MKNKKFLMVIASTLLLMISCNQAVNVDQLLNNDNTRNQVFNKITSDHEMMTDFIDVMMKDNHAKMMMKEHKGMREMMMGDINMMDMMKEKPEMMKSMMGEMMKDGNMMGNMMKMMHEKGIMSEECVDSCMKTMKDKGMEMEGNMDGKMDGKMNGKMNGDKEDNHNSHNH